MAEINLQFNKDTVLLGHTSEDTAHMVDDYPYGFRLRTQIRYWLETVAKNGDRFCSQTLNPKTGRWNKPKKSTYSKVGAMYLDEKGHVTWTGLSHYSTEEGVAYFREVMGEDLSDLQKQHLAVILGVKRAYEGVTFTVREGQATPEEEAEQKQMEQHLRRRIAVESHLAHAELTFDEAELQATAQTTAEQLERLA